MLFIVTVSVKIKVFFSWCQNVHFYYLGAKLSGAKLSGAELSGAKLSGAKLSYNQKMIMRSFINKPSLELDCKDALVKHIG